MSESNELIDLQALADKHGLSLIPKSKSPMRANRGKAGKRYKSVICGGGCGHIFRDKWQKHLDIDHKNDKEKPSYRERVRTK